MRREERVTVQGPVKEQQPDGMSHRGGGGGSGGERNVCLAQNRPQLCGLVFPPHSPAGAGQANPPPPPSPLPGPPPPMPPPRGAFSPLLLGGGESRTKARRRPPRGPGPRKATTTRRNVTQGEALRPAILRSLSQFRSFPRFPAPLCACPRDVPVGAPVCRLCGGLAG